MSMSNELLSIISNITCNNNVHVHVHVHILHVCKKNALCTIRNCLYCHNYTKVQNTMYMCHGERGGVCTCHTYMYIGNIQHVCVCHKVESQCTLFTCKAISVIRCIYIHDCTCTIMIIQVHCVHVHVTVHVHVYSTLCTCTCTFKKCSSMCVRAGEDCRASSFLRQTATPSMLSRQSIVTSTP